METIREEVKDGDTIVTPETITTYTRDAAGRTLTTRRDIGAMTTTESTEYDILGRVTRQMDILGRVTTTAYSADGLTTTVTTPTGAATITLRNTDGSTARISGTSQREQHYSYTRNGNNLATTVTLTCRTKRRFRSFTLALSFLKFGPERVLRTNLSFSLRRTIKCM